MGISVEFKLSVIFRYTFGNAQFNEFNEFNSINKVRSPTPHPPRKKKLYFFYFFANIKYALLYSASLHNCSVGGTNQMPKFQKKRKATLPYSKVKNYFLKILVGKFGSTEFSNAWT